MGNREFVLVRGDVRPSVKTVFPPSATRVKALGRELAAGAAMVAPRKVARAAMENFILRENSIRSR